MNSLREVVITGMGVVSPLGIGVEPFIAALRAGRSGVTLDAPLAEAASQLRIGARVRDFDGKNFVQPRKAMKVMSREIQTAYAAAEFALKHAGLSKGAVEPERFGVVLGSEMLYGDIDEMKDVFRHCLEEGEFHFDRWGKNAMQDIFPLWMLKYLPNMAACHVGIVHDARGPNNTIMQGEASSLIALMEAASYIQRDLADVVMAGGTGSRLSESAIPFRGTLNLATYDGDPTKASRPFDAARTGLVNGEGSGVLVLESRQHAEQRGAKIWARVAGFASRTEAGHRQQMKGSSIAKAIQGALQMASLGPGNIGHVNAHGLSMPHDDRIEAAAIASTLGKTPVTALKSYFGYLGAGAGAVELAAAAWSVAENEISPTLNYEQPDPACPIQVIAGEALSGQPPVCIKLNHTPLGQAAAVVIAAV